VTSWRMGITAISAGVRRSNDPPILLTAAD